MTPPDPRAAAKAAARTALDAAWDEVRGLSHALHARPELGYVEYFAARTTTNPAPVSSQAALAISR